MTRSEQDFVQSFPKCDRGTVRLVLKVLRAMGLLAAIPAQAEALADRFCSDPDCRRKLPPTWFNTLCAICSGWDKSTSQYQEAAAAPPAPLAEQIRIAEKLIADARRQLDALSAEQGVTLIRDTPAEREARASVRLDGETHAVEDVFEDAPDLFPCVRCGTLVTKGNTVTHCSGRARGAGERR